MFRIIFFTLFILISSPSLRAETFSADFQGVDIQEFINTASRNLGKTIIIDNAVSGKITVRSYEQLSAEDYYHFFLNVLDVYGYVVISMPKNVLKVVPAQEGRRAALIPYEEGMTNDELVAEIMPLRYTEAKNISPILRQLNDSIGVGTVFHYENSNSLLIIGRANIVQKIVILAKKLDQESENRIQTIPLLHASAKEVAQIVNEFLKGEDRNIFLDKGKIVTDERTNSVLISGNREVIQILKTIITRLDTELVAHSNTKVIPLKYAKAKNLVEILTGVSAGLQDENQTDTPTKISILKNSVIKADEYTNSLILSAPADIMRDLEYIIEQLDVRRAQVLVEAIIVEMLDAEGINFGIQLTNRKPESSSTPFSSLFESDNGLVTGFYHGNWSGLLTAINNSTQNNILATPSIVTLDNEDAEFSVGQDVPILTGSQTTNSDNVFNTVSRKTVGIKLKVKPQINQGNSVQLQIAQEVSSIADNNPNDKNSLGAIFNVRTVNNSVLVDSGQIVVVGGLLDKSQSKSKTGIPFLNNIPGLGYLFGTTGYKDNKRNLVLFIRPIIIRSTDEYSVESYRKSGDFNHELIAEKKSELTLQQTVDNIRNSEQFAFIRVKNDIESFYGWGSQ